MVSQMIEWNLGWTNVTYSDMNNMKCYDAAEVFFLECSLTSHYSLLADHSSQPCGFEVLVVMCYTNLFHISSMYGTLHLNIRDCHFVLEA